MATIKPTVEEKVVIHTSNDQMEFALENIEDIQVEHIFGGDGPRTVITIKGKTARRKPDEH